MTGEREYIIAIISSMKLSHDQMTEIAVSLALKELKDPEKVIRYFEKIRQDLLIRDSNNVVRFK